MLCSSKLTYLGRPGPVVLPTTITESCNTAPLMSCWQIIMQPSLRGLWKTVSCLCKAPRRGLQMTGFEMFSGRRCRATPREITALLRIISRKQAIWLRITTRYRSHGLLGMACALIWECRLTEMPSQSNLACSHFIPASDPKRNPLCTILGQCTFYHSVRGLTRRRVAGH